MAAFSRLFIVVASIAWVDSLTLSKKPIGEELSSKYQSLKPFDPINCPFERQDCGTVSCEYAKCNSFPDAICVDSNCGGCNVQFYDLNGNPISHQQCDNLETTTKQPCEAGFVKCYAPPCRMDRCPAHPDATCTNNYCGGCHAIWSDTNGNTLSKAQCKIPMIPPVIPKLPTSIPQIPLVTTESCTEGWMHCDPLPCDVFECTAYPQATCTNNKCGTCTAEFRDANGAILTQSQCDGAPSVIAPIPLSPSYTIATLGNTNEKQPQLPDMPYIPAMGTKVQAVAASACTVGLVQCARTPCSAQKCYAYPSATCENDYCGGCNAIFYNNGVELSKAQCAGGNILTALNGGNFPSPRPASTTTTKAASNCIEHRKTGCSVDSDCCRSDGMCFRGRCRRKRQSSSLRSVAVEGTFDNFDGVPSNGNSNKKEPMTTMGGMMVSVWSVGFVFICLMIGVPVIYYWYYKNYLKKKFFKAAQREIFHGLEINEHSECEFADSEEDAHDNFVE